MRPRIAVNPDDETPNPVRQSTLSQSGPLMRLHVTSFEIGRERSVKSAALKPRQAEILALREHAEAMARETWREIFDPEKIPEHRLREAEYQKVLTDRASAEDARDFSAADVRERENEFARHPASQRPTAYLLMGALVVGIGGTIAPTLHDFAFSAIEDDSLSWLLSMTSAAFVAAVIVWAILGSISATGRRTTANWTGLVAGIAVSVGLGVLRLSGAMGLEELAFAFGLTIVEIGLVVLAEWVASGLRPLHSEWDERQIQHTQAAAELDAARAENGRREIRLKDIEEKIQGHLEYVEDLSRRNMHVDQLIETATKSTMDGYSHGIAENRGHVMKGGRLQ